MCVDGGVDVARALDVESQIDPAENYTWLDFVKETHRFNYKTVYHALDDLLPKLKKVVSKITAGKGFVMVKDGLAEPFTMKEAASLEHTVTYWIDCGNGEQTLKTIPLQKFMEEHLNLMSCFNKVVFKPNDVALQPREFNTWGGFQAKLVTNIDMDKVNPWLGHIRDVWANGDEHTYRYIMSWFKQGFTSPETPCGVALLIRGDQGAGKTMVADFVADHVYGRTLSLTTTGLDSILARFNKCIMSRVFINVNELCTINESFHVAFDKLKPLITDKTLQIEPKFGEHLQIQNCANFLLSTNHTFTVKFAGSI